MDDSLPFNLPGSLNSGDEHGLQVDSPYSPIDRRAAEIRLINLSPGLEDQLCCSVRTYALKDSPPFTALSYTWGRAGGTRHIQINDVEVQIRENLWRFLQQLQNLKSLHRRFFWIDALCIDQSNDQERSHQVGLMHSIYRTATDVLVWLGPAYSDSDVAVRAISSHPSEDQLLKLWKKQRESSAICQLCDRKYWTRLWVVQELVLARDVGVLCGEKLLRWSDFESFVHRSKAISSYLAEGDHPQFESTMAGKALQMMAQVGQAQQQSSLYDQIVASGKLGCSDPRDKVYALLGIVSGGHSSISVDYNLGMPTLLNKVLRNEYLSHPPETLREAIEKCRRLEQAVGVERGSIARLEVGGSDDLIPHEVDMAETPLAIEDVSFWWASFYRHEWVRQLWLQVAGPGLINHAFTCAASNNRKETCAFLINSGVIEKRTKDNALLLCSRKGFHELAALLMTASAPSSSVRDEYYSSQPYFAPYPAQDTAFGLPPYEPNVNRNLEGSQQPFSWADSKGYDYNMIKSKEMTKSFDLKDLPEPWPPLAIALESEQTEVVQLLLEWLAVRLDQPANSEYGYIAACAAQRGFVQLALQVVEACTTEDLLRPDLQHGTLLQSAVKSGNTPAALRLIRLLDVNSLDSNWNEYDCETALMLAARHSNNTVVNLLLERTDLQLNLRSVAGPNKVHWRRRTLLEEAIHQGNIEIVERVLRRQDVDVNLRTKDQSSLLHKALKHYGETGSALCALLLQREDIDVNCQDCMQEPPLCFAIRTRQKSTMEELMKRPELDVNCQGYGHSPPLCLAIEKYEYAAIKALLKRPEVNVNCHGYRKGPPLCLAIRKGQHETVEELLKRPDLKVNCRDRDGLPALCLAISRDGIDIAELLLSRPDLDVDIKTPIDDSGDRRALFTPLWQAAYEDRLWAVRLLLETERVDINWACQVYDADMSVISCGIHAGASVDILECLVDEEGLSIKGRLRLCLLEREDKLYDRYLRNLAADKRLGIKEAAAAMRLTTKMVGLGVGMLVGVVGVDKGCCKLSNQFESRRMRRISDLRRLSRDDSQVSSRRSSDSLASYYR